MSNPASGSGWIKLHRALSSNELYFSEPFTRAQAWVDLLLIANHTAGAVVVRGNIVKVPRGCTAYGERTLADRWKWSRDKVRRFLDHLQDERQIARIKSNVTTLIEVVNYDYYQGSDEDQKDAPKTIPQTLPQKQPQKSDLKASISRSNEARVAEDPTAETTADPTADNTTDQPQTDRRQYHNKNDKKNKKKDTGAAPAAGNYSDYQLENFNRFTAWVDQHAPKVNKLAEPITIDQYLKVGGVAPKSLKEVLLAMQNKRDLLKTYTSAYLTLINWLDRRGVKPAPLAAQAIAQGPAVKSVDDQLAKYL